MEGSRWNEEGQEKVERKNQRHAEAFQKRRGFRSIEWKPWSRLPRSKATAQVGQFIAEHQRSAGQSYSRSDQPQPAGRTEADGDSGAGDHESSVDGMRNQAVDALLDQARGRKCIHRQSASIDPEG